MLFKKSKAAEAAPAKSEATTVAPSENVSEKEVEQEKEVPTIPADTRSISSSSSNKMETTGLEEAKALDKPDDEIVYPTGAKLAFITFALCLSVFLMALVGCLLCW
jgi:hypothetical protein